MKKIEWKQKKIETIILVLILFGGILVRILLFGRLPYGVNADEAMGAVDAYALACHGTDRFGTPFPVHFRAWSMSQMSVGMAYLQCLCIRLFGYSTLVIRIPALVLSLVGMLTVYVLVKEFLGGKTGLIALFVTAICPWHFIQSRWAMDCNAFPHIFLVAFALLLFGAKKGKAGLIYLSMVFFGFTFYCYGVAVYSVPLFLLGFSLLLIKRRSVSVRQVLLCIVIFFAIGLPEIIVLCINALQLPTIYTPVFTMEYFPDSIRSNDILLVHFSFSQLWENIRAVVSVLFLQPFEGWHNNVPKYGTLYLVSDLFGCLGLLRSLYCIRKKEDDLIHIGILGYFLTAVWIGLVTNTVNVNRLNLIFYPWLLYVAIGIVQTKTMVTFAVKKLIKNEKRIQIIGNAAVAVVLAGYFLLGAAFFRLYFLKYELLAGDRSFYAEYIRALEYIDDVQEYDVLYLTAYTGHYAYIPVTEILTNYAAKHDALYLQGKTNVSGGREVLPYSERYHYFYSWEEDEKVLAEPALSDGYRVAFLVHEEELEGIDMVFLRKEQIGSFCILEPE